MDRSYHKIVLSLLVIAAFGLAAIGHAQDPLGGPYTPDDNTVLLMHFDSTFTNESPLEVADGDSIGDIYFQDTSATAALGPSLYFNNLNGEDNYVAVQDTPALDLAHEWTIEAWVNPDTFDGEFNQAARIFFKPGKETFFHSNFYVAPYDDGHLRTGFYTQDGITGHHNVDSPDGIFQEDEWYHLIFIKDSTRKQVVQIITDAQGNLLNYQSEPEPNPAHVTADELRIGRGNSSSQRWIGNIDEARISNVPRQYDFPLPVLTYFEQLPPQRTTQGPYPVKAMVENQYGTGAVSATLQYDVGSGWQDVPMTEGTGDTLVAEIPDQIIPVVASYRVVYEATNTERTTSRTSGTKTVQISPEAQQVLALTFENGEGQPVDTTTWTDSVGVRGGDTTYVDNTTDPGVVGNYAYSMDGVDDYLEIDNSVLKLPVVTVDMRFKLNGFQSVLDLNKPLRLISKMGDWWPRANYAVHIYPDSTISGFVYNDVLGNTESQLLLDTTLTTGVWYRVIFSVTTDAAFLELRNADDEILDTKTVALPGPITLSDNTLVIGRAGEDPAVDPSNDNQPYFHGLVDDVIIYNYPAIQGPPLISHVDKLPPQSGDAPDYPVTADVRATGAGPMTVNLYYVSEFGAIQNPMNPETEGSSIHEGVINGQPGGSLVPYYVKATVGDYEAVYPEDAETDSNYIQFGVQEPMTQTLDISFNEGEGVPHDSSMYGAHHEFMNVGAPWWSTDAAEGPYSIAFEGDSSHVELQKPYFVSSPTYTLDFWFKADSAPGGTDRMVMKAGEAAWPNGTFHVRNTSGNQISAWPSIEHPDGNVTQEKMDYDSSFTVGAWHHFIMEVRPDTFFSQLRDSSDNLIQELGMPMPDGGHAIVDNGTLYIGQGMFSSHHWPGKIDKIKLYNFPVLGTPPTIENVNAVTTNQTPDDGPFTISADIYKTGAGLSSADLHYTTDGETWTTEAMAVTSGNTRTADIPGQSAGTFVAYYLSAEDEYGNRVTMPQGAETDSTYYKFAIWEENSQTLNLAFEEGSGVPMDSTVYNQPVEAINDIIYTGGFQGDYAYQFTAYDDSNYLEIQSPVLMEAEYTVDFWFRADSLEHQARIFSKQGGSEGIWWQPSVQIMLWQAEGLLRAASYIEGSGLNGGDMETTNPIEVGNWYRVVFTSVGDSTIFELRDSNNMPYDLVAADNGGQVRVTDGPLTIGHAGPVDNKYFKGAVDHVQIYNYAEQIPTVAKDENAIPKRFALSQNYPNPFNPTTQLNYDVPRTENVKIVVYDLLGRQVKTLVNQDNVQPGRYTVEWNGTNQYGTTVASGVYFYHMKAGDFTSVKKMVLLR